MAKPLVFSLGGSDFSFEMAKVDRAKLYGYKDVEIFDEQGDKCEMATLAEDGHTIIGRGGTGVGYLSADGLWCEKTQLRPVDLSGQPIEPVTSSFAAPIALAEPTTADDYLAHSIRSIYWLSTESGGDLVQQLKSGSIFKFGYSYRGGLEADVAFLLCNEVGDVFMAVGNATAIEFVGLQQTAIVLDDDAEQDEGDGDEMDFGMI